MPMPHGNMRKLIERRLRGTDGRARIKVLRECIAMLPGYKQGPYADLRKWLLGEIETTKVRRSVRHRDGAFVPRDGDRRVVLLGPPNAGKSSLLRALAGSSVQVGDYAFTTLRPVAATALINEARIQLVEIPGLLKGAQENKGGGRMYLAASKDADGYLILVPPELHAAGALEAFWGEIQGVVAESPAVVAATKSDLPSTGEYLRAIGVLLGDRKIVPVSTLSGDGLDALAEALWDMLQIIRIYPVESAPSKKEPLGRPIIAPVGTTVLGLAGMIHQDLARDLLGATVWGPSARFPGQAAGKNHVLQDGDKVRLHKKNG